MEGPAFVKPGTSPFLTVAAVSRAGGRGAARRSQWGLISFTTGQKFSHPCGSGGFQNGFFE